MVVPVNLEFGPGPQIRRGFLEFFPRRQIRGLQKSRFWIALAMPDKSARESEMNAITGTRNPTRPSFL